MGLQFTDNRRNGANLSFAGNPRSSMSVPASRIIEVTATGGTEPRTLEDHFSDILNLKDFGAVGDGVTDDLAAFTAALSASSASVIFVPEGDYRLSAGIAITGGRKLVSFGFVPGNPATGTRLVDRGIMSGRD